MNNPSEQEIHFEKERARSLASYKATLDERDEELAEARNAIGPGSLRWQALDTELKSARGTCQDIFAALHRMTDGKRIPNWLILILALVFAALEAPINKFMLDNVLQGNNFDSYALSWFMTLTILLLAHIAGVEARQIRGAYEERIYWGRLVVFLLIMSFLSVCVGVLTIGRAYYSTTATALPSSNIFAEVAARVLHAGPWAAFVAALSDQAAFFLATLNMAGIAGSLLLAFISYDSDLVYQGALDKAEKAQRRLDGMAKKYDRRLETISRKRHRSLHNLAAAYGAQNAEVIAFKRARGAPLTEDDHVELGKLDRLLEQARAEVAMKRPLTGSNDSDSRDEHVKGPQVIAMDRK